MMRQSNQVVYCASGKNYCYRFDDEKAYAAELGAKSKGHPNSFTHYEKMISLLKAAGHEIKQELFFEKRGDTTDLVSLTSNPGQFYEFTIYVQKKAGVGKFQRIYSPTSYVYDSLQN